MQSNLYEKLLNQYNKHTLIEHYPGTVHKLIQYQCGKPTRGKKINRLFWKNQQTFRGCHASDTT